MDAFVQRLPRASRTGDGKQSKNEVHERPMKRARQQGPEVKTESLEDLEPAKADESVIYEDGPVEGSDAPAKARPTDVENALPATQDEEEAIHEYEAIKASQSSPHSSRGVTAPDPSPKWTKWRSSIYVDAFILALDTVLEDESHLFDEAEKEIFRQWKQLDYEAQYLYGLLPSSSLSSCSPFAYSPQICSSVPPQDRLLAPVQPPRLPLRRLGPREGD